MDAWMDVQLDQPTLFHKKSPSRCVPTWRLIHCSVVDHASYLTFEMQSPPYEPFLVVTEFSDTGKTCEATAKRIDGNRGTSTKLLGLVRR